MAIRNKTTSIYTEWLPLIESLPNEIAGAIFKNILKYQNGEDIKNEFPVWVFIKSKIDEYNELGKQISRARSEAGKKGMANRWGITNDNKCYQMITSDNKNNNKIKENNIKDIETINVSVSGNNNKEKLSTYPQNKRTVKIEEGKFFMDDTIPEYKEALQGMTDDEILKLWTWIMNRYGGQEMPIERIAVMIRNFNRREKHG